MANTPLGLWSYVSDPFIEYVSSYLRSSIETRGLYKPSQIPRIPITPTQHRINNQANSLSNTKPFQFHLPKHNEALHHLFWDDRFVNGIVSRYIFTHPDPCADSFHASSLARSLARFPLSESRETEKKSKPKPQIPLLTPERLMPWRSSATASRRRVIQWCIKDESAFPS